MSSVCLSFGGAWDLAMVVGITNLGHRDKMERLRQVQQHLREGKENLNGRIAIITGCNSKSGIGAATAKRLVQQGLQAVYICDVSDTNLGGLRRELENLGGKAHIHTFDAANEPSIERVVHEAVQTYGRLDVMFANAGVLDHALLHDLTEEEYMRCMRVNALGVFLAIKHSSIVMKNAGQGSIIATASVAGIRSGAGGIAYSASKAAVINMVQTCAWQLAGTGIRVNAICPGLIETGMTVPTFQWAASRGTSAKIGQLNPSHRAASAEEVATLAAFLAGDGASYINGQAIAVDGGLSASHPVVPGKFY